MNTPMSIVAAQNTYTIRVVDVNSAASRPELVDATVYSLAQAKQSAVWLTKGIDRDQPAVPVLLKDCTPDHLRAILATKQNLSADYRSIIEALLADADADAAAAKPSGLLHRITVFLRGHGVRSIGGAA